jgi:DNA-binding CsgD family transcriptional regulator
MRTSLPGLPASGDIEALRPLSRDLVKNLTSKWRLTREDREDLYQEAMYAVCTAVAEYRPNKGAALYRWVTLRVRSRIWDFLDYLNRKPRTTTLDDLGIESDEIWQFSVDPFGRAFLAMPEDKEPNTRLTQRELEVLGLICGGSSVEETAARLCIVPKSVRFHIQSIHAKWNVNNTVKMYREAMMRGVIDPPGRRTK